MRLLAIACFLAACSSSSATPIAIDAQVPDAPRIRVPDGDTCNTVSQTGCGSVDERCTWIRVDATCWEIGCVPAGTLQLGDACTRGPDGVTTGYDDCVAGTVCGASTCAQICNVAPDSCDPATHCIAFGDSVDTGYCAP